MLFRSMVFPALLALCAHAESAQTDSPPLSRKQRDAQIVHELRDADACRRAEHVIICVEPGQLPDASIAEFLREANAGAAAIRKHLGVDLDIPGGNHRQVEFFISRNAGIPHVTIAWEPWIFMHPETVARGMAPYLHEMVHVMAQWSWRNSEWIAEGFANYVASAVAEQGTGYHRSFVLPDGLARLPELYASPEGREMIALVGVPGRRHSYGPADADLMNRLQRDRRRYAPVYYAMSWSLVHSLADDFGVGVLRSMAASDDPSGILRQISGQSLEFYKAAWQKRLTKASKTSS